MIFPVCHCFITIIIKMDATTIMQKSINDLMATFTQRMDSFEDKLAKTPNPSPSRDELAEEFSSFKTFMLNSLRAIQGQIERLAASIDQLEMRGRRKMLLLHGLAEVSSENTGEVVARFVVERLKQTNFTADDISRCHRMGRAGIDGKPRPVLCKFRDMTVRDKIWSAKAGLKGSGITISEFLTKARHDLFMAARQHFGISKCWTREGFIFVIGVDGARHRVCCPGDIDVVLQKVAPKPTVVKEPATSRATRRAAASKK